MRSTKEALFHSAENQSFMKSNSSLDVGFKKPERIVTNPVTKGNKEQMSQIGSWIKLYFYMKLMKKSSILDVIF
jgi:hypothetical protein